MTACTLLAWLAVLALCLALLVVVAPRLIVAPWAERLAKRLCPVACRLAVITALLAGVLFGYWLCCCGPETWRALARPPCLRTIALLLVLLIAVLIRAVIAAAVCGKGVRWALLVPLVLVLFLYLLGRCCHVRYSELLTGGHCARVLMLGVVLVVIATLLWAIHARYCKAHPKDACTWALRWLWFALAITVLATLLLWRCCKDKHPTKDYDLAMIGIWWDGQQPGESGVHLRWAFRTGLPFPPGGFDLFRREGSGSWTQLNGAPIRPADVFEDGAPAPGPMWQHRGVDRLHSSRWDHFRTPFGELHTMLGLPPYTPVYFVEEPADTTLPQPTSPYPTAAARDTYLDAYRTAAGPDAPPLAVWELEPMTLIQTTALDPELARLVGLLYIDGTAAPDTEYDYRVVGHWSDGDRSYTITRISRPRTAPLATPVLEHAVTPLMVTPPAGGPTGDDATVGVRWTPPVADPDFALTQADGIVAVRWQPLRKDLGARPCPAPGAPDAGYLPPPGDPSDDDQTTVAPVAITPEEVGADLVWPAHFFVDRRVVPSCWGYAVQGVDLFGRTSSVSNVRVADVRDLTGPPPPLNVEARVFQRADTAALAELTATERDALFPPASTHAAALRVSWAWPDAFLASVPDATEFRVLHQIAGYATFQSPAWKDPAAWDDAGVAVPITAGGPLPPHLIDAGVTAARWYQAIVFEPPMAPGDDAAVVYGYASVTTVDQPPWNNRGMASPPVVIFARDLVPPDPPPAPSLVGDPRPIDGGANAALALHVTADSRYTYELLRVSGRALAALPLPTTPPPPCLVAPTDVARKAAAHPELFRGVLPAPAPPVTDGAGFALRATDRVDGTIGDDHVYAARAIDAAGNRSALGCPTVAVVRDSFPPRAPVFARVVGAEGRIDLTWSRAAEVDVVRFRLLRTADPALDGSLDRMEVVLEAEPDGNAVAPPGAADATTAGAGTAYPTLTWRDQDLPGASDRYYRLVAIDSSGNVSALSRSTKARAFDTTPPLAPAFATTPAPGSDVTGPFVDLSFAAPAGDGDARIRLQRRETGSPLWRPLTDWLVAGTTTYRDRDVAAGRAYTYRLQAMDAAGNVGERSEPRSTP